MPSLIELRAREPAAGCLIRKLIVPRVYFGVEWPIGSGTSVDVLAIDRDGSGDAHIVAVRERAADANIRISAGADPDDVLQGSHA